MELEKINLEKSWNFVSDSKRCKTKFPRCTRTSTHAVVHFIIIHWFFQVFISIIYSLIVMLYKSFCTSALPMGFPP